MGATASFSKASWGMYTDFQEAFKKLFVAPNALELLFTLQQEALAKSVKF
jgi:hypothetical protein